jgi:hypothetical protein
MEDYHPMKDPDHALSERVFAQLRMVIRQLGHGGGAMTPSVYETAQVLRFCPELIEVDRGVDWLLRCQLPDGGWNDPASPLYRDVPTLAALLALRTYHRHERVRWACNIGHRFLEQQTTVIDPTDGEYLPVGMELILPRLLDQAEDMGLWFSRARFRHIESLGERRRQLLSQHQPLPNSPPVFSWEAWGTCPDIDLVSPGGVGHNPAATAWWLYLDRGSTHSRERTKAIDAIMHASRAAGAGIKGVVPDAWPMDRFEQSFVLHVITMAGLLNSERLSDVIAPQLEDLRMALTSCGLGFSDYFEPDGDDSAAAVAAIAAAGLPVDSNALNPFKRADRFVAYPFETHGSYTVTARASHAMRITGYRAVEWRPFILKSQQPDGWWTSDKWNRSRLYGTCVALSALDESDDAKSAAAEAFLRYQHTDGGWGCFGKSTLVETAFGVLALRNIALHGSCRAECLEAISAAHRYLRRMYQIRRVVTERMWICKDVYSAIRIDHAAILCALLTSAVVPDPVTPKRAFPSV